MATAVFVQEGDSVDITPSSAIAAGDVVKLDKLLGVAKLDIAANTLGAIALVGVYTLAKSTSEAVAAGADLWYDTVAKTVTGVYAAGGNLTYFGKAVAAAAQTAATVNAKLIQDVGGAATPAAVVDDHTVELYVTGAGVVTTDDQETPLALAKALPTGG